MHRTRARTGATGVSRKAAETEDKENAVVLPAKSVPAKPALGAKNAKAPAKQAPAEKSVVVAKKTVKTTTTTTTISAAPRRALAGRTNEVVKRDAPANDNKENAKAKVVKRPAQVEAEEKHKKQKVAQAVAKPKVEDKKVAPAIKKKAPPKKVAELLKEDEEEVDQEERDWDDLDKDDAGDPLMVSEYVVKIFDYLKDLESQTLPNPNYMDDQKELQWQMRGILIDWLIEVHYKFRLLPETLFLAVNIIDRFLTLRVVSLQKLQLVGLTALFIASKYEEVMAPSISNFLYMSDGGYTDAEILKAERYILSVLGFGLHYPNALNFLRRCSKADAYDIQTRTLAKYLMEVALVDHKFLVCTPSEIAAAGLYLARRMLKRGAWDANLTHYSGYNEGALQPAVNLMISYLSQSPAKHDALYRKYASKKFMKASIFVKDWIDRQSAAQANAAVSPSSEEDVDDVEEEEEDDE